MRENTNVKDKKKKKEKKYFFLLLFEWGKNKGDKSKKI